MGRGEGTATLEVQGSRRCKPASNALRDRYREIDTVDAEIRAGDGPALEFSSGDGQLGTERIGHYLAESSLYLARSEDQLSTGTIFESELVRAFCSCNSDPDQTPSRIDRWAWQETALSSSGADVVLLAKAPSQLLASMIRSGSILYVEGEPRRAVRAADGTLEYRDLPARVRQELGSKVQRIQCKSNYAELKVFDHFRFALLHRINQRLSSQVSGPILDAADRERVASLLATALDKLEGHDRLLTINHKPTMNSSRQRTDVRVSVGEFDDAFLAQHLHEIKRQLREGRHLHELKGPYTCNRNGASLSITITGEGETGPYNILSIDIDRKLWIRTSHDLITEHQRFTHQVPVGSRERMIAASSARERELLTAEKRAQGLAVGGAKKIQWGGPPAQD